MRTELYDHRGRWSCTRMLYVHEGGTFWGKVVTAKPEDLSGVTRAVQVGVVKSDVIKTANWKEKIAAGVIINNPYSATRVHIEQSGAEVMYTSRLFSAQEVSFGPKGYIYGKKYFNSIYGTGTGRYHSPNIADVASVSAGTGINQLVLYNRALASFQNKIKTSVQAFNGLDNFGEILEVWHGLKHPFKALRDGFDDFAFTMQKASRQISRRKGFNYALDEYAKVFTDTWLEWNLGWAPLASAVEEGATAIASMVADVPHKVRISGFAEDIIESHSRSDEVTHVFGLAINGKLTRYVDITDVCRFSFYGALVSPKGQLAIDGDYSEQRAHFGATLRALPQAAWELTPESFVADYYSNIGDMINNATIDTSRILYLGYTVKAERSISRYGMFSGTADNGYVGGGAVDTLITTGSSFNRYPLLELPKMDLVLEVPPLISKKWITVTSLLHKAPEYCSPLAAKKRQRLPYGLSMLFVEPREISRTARQAHRQEMAYQMKKRR